MSRFISVNDPNFYAHQQREWAAPPIDGKGYIPSTELLKKSNAELCTLIEMMGKERYEVNAWRNHKNLWREKLGLDSTHDKIVLDYGCGCGIEALQFAKTNNQVWVADIAIDNVNLAERTLNLFGYNVYKKIYLTSEGLNLKESIDIFYCNGVLHHIPYARDVMERAAMALIPNGEIRLLLYSDTFWKIVTESSVPPVEEKVETNPKFIKFTAALDGVGAYADWYSADKLIYRFGDFLDLISYDYICNDGALCVAILKKK
jgi:SAM-dependent methyltransferase